MKARNARVSPVAPAARPVVRGAIEQRQKGFFVLRLKVPCGNATATLLSKLAELSIKYGKGELHLTTRQGIEIPWIPSESLESALKDADSAGFTPGASGPRIRAVTACPGNRVCRHGQRDSRGLAEKIDREFFGADVPHKFKIAVAGCPNACTKPMENDLGFGGMAEPGLLPENCLSCGKCQTTCKEGAITLSQGIPVFSPELCMKCGDCIRACPAGALEATRCGYRVYAGGKMGRHPRMGLCIAEFVDDEQAMEIIRRSIEAYKRYGRQRERFGDMIDRVGIRKVKPEILGRA